ncbi:MAG: T9SS type A sorting domain-containing protein [Flavobacteriaceae bacterium]
MKIFIKLFFITTTSISIAQINYSAPWVKEMEIPFNEKILFNDVVDSGNAYWETRDKNAKGSGYKPFKRWEAYWQNYVDDSGYLPSRQQIWDNWLKKTNYSQMRTSMQSTTDESNWISVGPTDFLNRSTSYLNLGRVNCITPHPTNSNILYVGTPSGGIWKSIDGGLTYIPLSDILPQIGVSSIAIDQNNPDVIYIATGDDDAGDSYSVGVWKSYDGGYSWGQTAMNPNNSPSKIYELEMDQSDSSTIWAATNNGLFITNNGGNTWSLSQSGAFQGVKQKPGDSSTIYAITDSQFFKSLDGGNSFTSISFGLPRNSARMVMDVTKANSDLVYILASTNNYEFEGLYKSFDEGNTFIKMNNTTDIYESSQAWYDLAFAVSDTNENEIYSGVLNIWKSSDGGNNFTKLNEWYLRNETYTHADIHFLKFYNNELYVGSDGGFFKSSDQGDTFYDLTANMAIGQFYRVSVSKQNANKIAGGTQDNGGFAYFNQWNSYHGGDGMESVIDPNNDNLYYGFMQLGQTLFVNENSGMFNTTGYSGPTNGNWITPLSINSESEVFAGYNRLYQFENENFTAISQNFGTNIDILELDPINSQIIYVATNEVLYKSIDKGVSFTNLGSFPNNLTAIEVNNNNNNIVYVATRGSSGKVYQSIDQGDSFSDITGNLPAVVKNVIKHQPDTPQNILYVGTSLGVFRYDDNTNDWFAFENNLPNTSVTDLSININDNQIIASTYGRGVWRSTMGSTALAENDIKLLAIQTPSTNAISCGNIIPQIIVKNNGQNLITQIEISYNIDNEPVLSQTWTGSIASLEQEVIDLESLSVAFGNQLLSVNVNIENDAYPTNNSAEISISSNKTGETQTVYTFESENDDFLVAANSGELWERGEPAGNQLNSTTSGVKAYATNLDGDYPNNTKGFLYSPCFDLSSIEDPVLKFKMAFDIEFDWDLLYMQYSTDLGQNWNILGSADSPSWYNSSRFSGDGINNDCYNCIGAQWTGTNLDLTEYSYNLTELGNIDNIIFRFVFHSDQYVTEEGVIIDDFVIEGTTLNINNENLIKFAVYPNPSSHVFNIRLNNITNYNLFVRDITTKLLFKYSGKNSNYELDLSGFAKGIYLLEIESNNMYTTKKIILK